MSAPGSQAADTVNVLIEVANERRVQRGRWGNDHDDRHDEAGWGLVLASYVGAVMREALSTWIARPTEEAEMRYVPQGNLRPLLVKVAATAVAWIEALDRRKP